MKEFKFYIHDNNIFDDERDAYNQQKQNAHKKLVFNNGNDFTFVVGICHSSKKHGGKKKISGYSMRSWIKQRKEKR